jgi:peptide/nickel transport system ATP-binding protein
VSLAASAVKLPMERVLEVEDLRVEFHMRTANVKAVDGVSFSVEQGECIGIVGESGCGKSTTGFSIMRLLPNNGHISGGRITLNGRDLAPLSEKEMRRVRGDEVALIPQDPLTALNPTMTIGRQIGEAVRLHRQATAEQVRQRALEVLSLVEMPRPSERLDQYPHELSGGLRQRVMIAMALACDPKLLIADEPTTALDVTIQAQILDLIDELRQRLQMAVVLITHDMGVVANRTDRVVVMYAGKVVEEASTGDLFARRRHPYSEALLRAVPRLDQDRTERLVSIPGLPPDLSKPLTACRFAPRCAYADATCRESEPELRSEGVPGHRFACFHPVAGPVQAVVRISAEESARREASRSAELAAQPVLLEVHDLVKEFPVLDGQVFRHKVGSVKAVTEVSFGLRRGETFGLVGESGCGKTTVGRMLVQLERPDSGSISFEGADITTQSRAERRLRFRDIQLMFQDPFASLDPRMRVGSIIQEPLNVQKIGTLSERRTRVLDLLHEVGLSSQAAERYPHEFSGGQRQRVGFARALALEPKLVVADEPVSALDVSIQAQLLNVMKDLQVHHELAYIMISHDLAVVRYMADTIGVMYLGRIVEIGPASEIYAHPAHPYTQGLLDAVPTPEFSPKSERVIPVRGELPSAVHPPSGCRFRTRCPRAQERCAIETPGMTPFGPSHVAACHFPLQTPVTLMAGTHTYN